MDKSEIINVGGSVETAEQGQYSIDIKTVLQEAWSITSRSRLSIVAGSIICSVLSLLIIFMSSQYLGGIEKALVDIQAQYIINILVTLVISPFIAGIEMMGVFHAVGIKTQPKLIFSFLSKGAIIAICALLSSTLSSLGFNLLILPGIFLLVTLSLTLPLVVEKNMMPMKAIILSIKALRFQFFQLLAIYGILFMALILSTFPLLLLFKSGFDIIGVAFLLFALTYLAPLFYNTKGILYRNIFGVQLHSSQASTHGSGGSFSA